MYFHKQQPRYCIYIYGQIHWIHLVETSIKCICVGRVWQVAWQQDAMTWHLTTGCCQWAFWISSHIIFHFMKTSSKYFELPKLFYHLEFDSHLNSMSNIRLTVFRLKLHWHFSYVCFVANFALKGELYIDIYIWQKWACFKKVTVNLETHVQFF